LWVGRARPFASARANLSQRESSLSIFGQTVEGLIARCRFCWRRRHLLRRRDSGKRQIDRTRKCAVAAVIGNRREDFASGPGPGPVRDSAWCPIRVFAGRVCCARLVRVPLTCLVVCWGVRFGATGPCFPPAVFAGRAAAECAWTRRPATDKAQSVVGKGDRDNPGAISAERRLPIVWPRPPINPRGDAL
jgi:hypothetical protein